MLCLWVMASTGVFAAHPETLVVAVPEDVITLDPARFGRHALTESVQHLMFRRLLMPMNGKAGPELSKQFYPIDDRRWVFEIDETASAQDGTPITAARIARFFQRSISPEGIDGFPSPAKNRLGPVERVEGREGQVIFHLSRPWPRLPSAIMREPVGVLDSKGEPVSTGLFALGSWRRGNSVTLTRLGNAKPGEPQRIRFEIIPSAQERLNRLLNGRVHVATSLPPGALWQLRASSTAKAVVAPQSRVYFVEFDTRRPPFNDVKVRRALNYAVDFQQLIDRVMQHEAQAVATLLSPVTLGFDPDIQPYRRDLARAKELLEEAGYPKGFQFELDVTPARYRAALVLREMLAEVGIDASLRAWPSWSVLREQILSGRRQAWFGEWGNSSTDPAGALIPKVHSRGETNYGGYRDPRLDALLDRAEATVDPDLRLERYREIQNYVLETAPMLFGYVQFDVYGASIDLDWQPGPEGLLRLETARFLTREASAGE